MAAGAYKGLTIRIGADTTKLSSALRGANSAIFKTQSELNKLNRAAKLDPGNAKLQTAQYGAMASQATAAAAKMDTLRKSIEGIRDTSAASAKHTTIGQLAEATGDAALSAEDAKDRYNSLTSELAKYYSGVKEVSGIDVSAAIRKSPQEYEKAIQKLREWGAASEENSNKFKQATGRTIEEFIQNSAHLRDSWTSAFNSFEDATLVESLHNAQTELALTESKVNSLSTAMANIRSASEFSMKGPNATAFDNIDSRMNLLNAAADAATDRFNRLDAALDLDPSNIDVARDRSQALADVIAVTEARSEELRKKISLYDGSGYKDAADDIGNVSKALEESRQSYANAEKAVAKYDGQLQNAKKSYQRLKDKDDGSESMAAAIAEAEQKVRDLTEEYNRSAEARDKALQDYDSAKAVSELVEIRTELQENEARAKSLGDAFGKLAVRSGIASSLDPLKGKLDAVVTGADNARSRFERLDQAAQIKPYSIQLAKQRVDALKEATNAARSKAQELKSRLDAYKSDGIDKIASRTRDSAVAFEKAQQNVRNAQKELANYKTQSDRTESGVRRLETALEQAVRAADTAAAVNEFKELETQVREAEAEVKSLKSQMGGGFGSAFSGFGAAAVQAASQLGQIAQQIGQNVVESSNAVDASYRDLRKTFDAEESDYKMLYDAAMKYSQSHVTAADSMLEMEAIAGQLGVGMKAGADGLRAFAEAGANLDVATDIDAETVALQMGQIMNVMSDVDTSNIDRFGDALVRLGNNMPTQESNIMQITQRLAAVGDVAGFSTPQLMGWAAAIASTGQKSEAAASGISTTITNISKAVGEGGDAVKGYADVAKMSADEFVKAWQANPHETLKKVVVGLKDSGDELFATLSGLDVNGVRQTQTLAALAQTVGTVDDAVTMASDAFAGLDDQWGKAGDASIEANKKAEGFSGSLAKMQNSAQVAGASLGKALVPYMNSAASALQELTKWLDGMDDGTKTAVVGIGALSAGFAAVVPIVSALATSFSTMAKSLAAGTVQLVGGVASKVGDVAAAIELFAESPKQAIGSVVDSAKGKIAGLGASVTKMAGSFSVAGGIIGAFGAAIGAYLISKAVEAKMHTERLDAAVSGLSHNAGSMDGLRTGTREVQGFGEASVTAKSDIEGLIDSIKDHNERQTETKKSAAESIEMLGQYQTVINELAGAGTASSEGMAKLQWALDGVKAATGEEFTAEQVLMDQYRDAQGVYRDTSDAIDGLIQKKQEEARVNALTELYTNAVKNQIEVEHQLDTARQELHEHAMDWGKEQIASLEKQGMAHEEAAAKVEEDYKTRIERGKEYARNVSDATLLLDSAKKEVDSYAEELGEAEVAQLKQAASAEDAASRSQAAWAYAAQQMGTDTGTLVQKLQEAGITSEQLGSVVPEHFAHMAAEANGDIQHIIDEINNYNAAEFQDKHSVFVFDEEGNLVTANNLRVAWNQEAGQWQYVETGVNVDDSALREVKTLIDATTGQVYEVPVVATADTGELDDANNEIDKVRSNAQQGAEMGVSADVDEVEDAGYEIDETRSNAQQGAEMRVTADTGQVDEANAKVDGVKQSAGEGANLSATADTSGLDEAKRKTDDVKSDAQQGAEIRVKSDTTAIDLIMAKMAQMVAKKQDVAVDYSQVDTALGKVKELRGNAKDMSFKVTADTTSLQSAMETVNQLRASSGGQSASMSFSADTSGIRNAMTAWNNLASMRAISKTATLTAKYSTVVSATIAAQRMNSTPLNSKRATLTATGNVVSGGASSAIYRTNAAINSLSDRYVTVTAGGNATNSGYHGAAQSIWRTINAINNLRDKTVTVTTKNVVEGKSATGGFRPNMNILDIPRNAVGGYIATRPTLTNYGWIGEAGAEAYVGDTLVPLTNRKYSTPWVRDISDAVARKLDGAGGDRNVNVYLSYDASASAAEMAGDLAGYLNRIMGARGY